MVWPSNIRRPYPGMPLALLLPCALLVVLGIWSDPRPPRPPAGVLVPARVLDGPGPADAVLLRVDQPGDLPVLCGIERSAFPGGRVPAAGSRITVDYAPTGCALPPVTEGAAPGWAVSVAGLVGTALMIFWLWAGSPRAARRRRLRRQARARAAARLSAPGTGSGAAADG